MSKRKPWPPHRPIKLVDRYATWHRCEPCNDEWEVYRTHRGASSCPNCDRMAPAYRIYDQHKDKVTHVKL